MLATVRDDYDDMHNSWDVLYENIPSNICEARENQPAGIITMCYMR